MEQITIPIEGDVIRLDQLLKVASLVPTGGQVRFMLEEHLILLNGVVIAERRRQIHPGDVVTVKDMAVITVVANE